MIYIVGTSIAFFLSILLLSKQRKTPADKILTCWLLVIAVHLLFYYLFFSGLSYRHPFLLGLDLPLPLVHGPMLYLYTASLTNQLPVGKKLLFLHFIPAVASWIYLVNFFILPGSQKVFVFQNKGLGFESFMWINLVAILISGIAYIITCLILLKRHRRAILDQFSYTEKINLKWLQFLIYGIGFIWLLVFTPDEVLFTGVVLFVVIMGYFGIKQPGIFTTHPANAPQINSPVKPALIDPGTTLNTNLVAPDPSMPATELISPDAISAEQTAMVVTPDDKAGKKKYSKSGLTAAMAQDLHDRLGKLMKTEKVYTESELSLAELANRLDTLPNYLSQVINEKEGKTFYDYINALRIEEFKRMISLPENKRYTLLSLSYDCGFNSKSSFNKNFKKVTGQSPSEYLNNLQMEKAA